MKWLWSFLYSGILAVLIVNGALAFPGKHSELCVFADELGLGSKEGLPERLAKFLGVYDGKWDGKLSHTLIVNRVKSDGTMMGFYTWGVYEAWRIPTPGCEPVKGMIDGEVLNFTLSSGAEVMYRFSGEDTFAGEFVRKGRSTPGIFKRVQTTTIESKRLTDVPTLITYPSGRISEMVETALMVDGEPARLQMFFKKPGGDGPFPLLIWNHGSTGRGDNPERFRSQQLFPEIEDYFVRRGWMVVTPHRRGRGWSDGLYDEGFDIGRRQYTCESTRSLEGADRGLEDVTAALDVLVRRPEIDGSRVVIGGQSRGGILSIAFSGKNPDRVLGVINVVGGWVGGSCSNASVINGALSLLGAEFSKPTLWLYGENDPYYTVEHSKSNFQKFVEAGGIGKFVVLEVPDGSGHQILQRTLEWQKLVGDYMVMIGFSEFRK